jgi:hypothetical protein
MSDAEPEPNVGCAPPSPPSGKAAGGVSAAGSDPSSTSQASPAPSQQLLGRPEVIEHARTLLLWAIPAVGKFPRDHRFTLGDRIQHRLYNVLELLLRATYAPRAHKRPLLQDSNVELEILRHELRLALDLRLLSERQVEHATRLIDAVGKQVGGWLRSVA